MTKEEKEKLIRLFESFKYKPHFGASLSDRENGRDEGIDWCIEEIQEFDCSEISEGQSIEQDRLGNLLYDYNKALRIKQKFVSKFEDMATTAISNYSDPTYFFNKMIIEKVKCRILKQVIKDLESLRDE